MRKGCGSMTKTEGMLGLAARAGKIVSGEFSTEKAIKDRRACLVIVAEDASARTKKLFHDKCGFYGVPIREYAVKEVLGHAIGKNERASLACTDRHFAEALQRRMEQEV